MLKIKFFLVICLLLDGLFLRSQNISGVWEGHSGPSSHYVMPIKVILELTTINDSLISGVSHAYYTRGRFEHHKLSGRIDRRSGFVYLSEDSIIDYKIGFLQYIDAGTYSLKLIKTSSGFKLDGSWTSRRKRLFVNPTIKKWFWKEKNDISKINLPDNTQDKASFTDSINKTNRPDDLQMIIEVDKKNKDSIKVDIYDNGEIDNDTVSVYINNRQVIRRQMISAKPITFYISLSEANHFDKIKLVAENLGNIPPNTALMIITTEKKKYNVFLSSNYEKNAVVEFFLKEK